MTSRRTIATICAATAAWVVGVWALIAIYTRELRVASIKAAIQADPDWNVWDDDIHDLLSLDEEDEDGDDW